MSSFGIRGIIEGFYGPPWSHSKRLDMLDFISKCKMNTYFLAPKDELGQRLNWREPLSKCAINDLSELANKANLLEISLGTAISPGQDITYSDLDDLSALKSRLKQFLDINIRFTGIFLDDIPNEFQNDSDFKRFHSLARAHAYLGNQLWEWLSEECPHTKFVICPNVYRGTGREEYLVELGKYLNPEIDIFWTGIQICSYRLDSRDAIIFKESAHRQPLYWDNYPVNDVAMVNELHIGPIKARESDLNNHCLGLLANPMTQAEASKIPLWTIGEYLLNPSTYNPDLAWERALIEVIGNKRDRDAYRMFASNSLGSCLNDDAAPEFTNEISAIIYNYRCGNVALAISKLHALAISIISAAQIIKSPTFSNHKLAQESAFWVDHFQRGGEILEILANSLVSQSGTELIQTLANEVSEWRCRIFGDSLHMFLTDMKIIANPV